MAKYTSPAPENNLQRYQQIVESTFEGIWTIDANGNTTYVNKRMAEMLGYRMEEMIGKHLFSFMDDEGQSIATRNMERRSHGIAEQHDFRFLNKDGQSIWMSMSTNPLYDQTGEYIGALAMAVDITERWNLEQQLKHQVEFEALLSGITYEFLSKSVRQFESSINTTLQKMAKNLRAKCIVFHFSDVLINKNFFVALNNGEIEIGDYLKQLIELDNQQVKDDPCQVEVRVIETLSQLRQEFSGLSVPKQLEEDYRPLIIAPIIQSADSNASLAILPGDQELSAILPAFKRFMEIFCRIIVAAIQRYRMEEALRESEGRLQQAIHIAKLGIWEWDIATDKTTWSGEMFNIYGIKPEEFTGRGQDYINFTHPDDKQTQLQNIQQAFQNAAVIKTTPGGQQRKNLLDPKELRIVRPDGSICTFIGDAVPIVDDEGRPVKMLGTALDITERKKAEMELEQYRQHLEELVDERTQELMRVNRELEAFAYSVSHDLRTPLRAIDGFSHIVLDDYQDKLDDAGKENLVRIRSAAQHMAGLIDHLLQLSRVARVPINAEWVNLSRKLTEHIKQYQSEHPDRLIRYQIQDDVKVQGDRYLLNLVLENLINNALKYTQYNEAAEITFEQNQINGETVYTLRDNGAGFEMQYVDKIFEVFQRLHDNKLYEGTGIGLATVQRIIQRHGGRIWAESEVGKGTTIFFTLGTA